MLVKIKFVKEFNNVVAYRDGGRVSDIMLPDPEPTKEDIQRALHWAYELGRRDRHWETQKFLQGQGTQPITDWL